MVQRWREALTQVADLSGWDIRHKSQFLEIQKITEEVISILGYKFSSIPKDLVGMDSPIAELESHLLLDLSDDVRAIGISGMGEIGKTTIANVVCARISHRFDACCVVDDVRKICRHDGPIGPLKQILHQTLGEEHLQINNFYSAYNLIHSRLRRVKALIILDNVDKAEQLEKLSSSSEWLGAGSRVIIISRDEHILKDYGVKEVYKVPLLNTTESLQLFFQKAFKLCHIMSGYENLVYEVLSYADGLPLAINVLGSFLFGRDVSEWRSALARLRESPNRDIMDVLRISFEGLQEMEKEIFLDIACFFNGFGEKHVKKVLDCCGFHVDIGLGVLVDKSLISISENRTIKMHDLLQELGRQIVQEDSSKEERKWSRLWLPEHFCDVVLENMEKSVEAVVMKDVDIKLMAGALSKMIRLRLLILKNVDFLGSLDCLSNKLRYIEWDEYPFMYLPSNFQPNHLVQLKLKQSNLKQLWKGKKNMPRLSVIDLKDSKNLIHMPNFEEISNLERLDLEGCSKLLDMDPSIGALTKLLVLVLVLFQYLLYPDPTSSHTVCQKKKSSHTDLLSSLPTFNSLRWLDISFCSLSVIPDAIGCLRSLEELNLGGNNFVSLPSLMDLSRLISLILEHCQWLESLPELPSPPVIDSSYYLDYDERVRGGLYIFNCPKLSKIREHCSRMTISWMTKFIVANQQYIFSFRTEIVIPGSEIPRWFNNQSEGNSITWDVDPIEFGDNFIGLAYCVVFSVTPHHHPTQTTNEMIPRLKIDFSANGGNSPGEGICVFIPINLSRDLINDKSDHMCLVYFNRDFVFECVDSIKTLLPDLISTKIYQIHENGSHVEVKKCGSRWLFS